MEDLLGKFSLYDFFNLLGAGGIFLAFLHFFDILSFTYFITMIDSENNYILMVFLLCICYMIGLLLQQIGNFLCCKIWTYQQDVTETFLLDDSNIFGNRHKLRLTQNRAKSVFKEKDITIDGGNFTKEQCVYFSHIALTISKSEEKMRKLKR